MATDTTVPLRKVLTAVINASAMDRTDLEKIYGQVWDTEEMRRDFEVMGFGSPLVVVKRRSDGKVGSLFFQATPRLYFKWEEDQP